MHDLTAIYNKIDKVIVEFIKNEFNPLYAIENLLRLEATVIPKAFGNTISLLFEV